MSINGINFARNWLLAAENEVGEDDTIASSLAQISQAAALISIAESLNEIMRAVNLMIPANAKPMQDNHRDADYYRRMKAADVTIFPKPKGGE